MTDVMIFGAGGLGRMVADILQLDERARPVAFLDSDPNLHGGEVDGLPVIGGLEAAARLERVEFVVAVGENGARVRIAERLRAMGRRLRGAIHPLANIAPSATIGTHVIIAARATICVHARVREHCVLSAGAIVEHDNRLDEGVFLGPAVRLAGGVEIGCQAWLGIGACVVPYRKVGALARVEPGAVVIRDVYPGATVGGAPARMRLGDNAGFVADAEPAVAKPAAVR